MNANKIAVIDSGINTDFPLFNHIPIESISLANGSDIDETGHGTAVAAEIIKFSGRLQPSILSIKILNEQNKSNLGLLCDALEYCLQKSEVSVVNISAFFNIESQVLIDYVSSLLKKLTDAGKYIVFALPNMLTTEMMKAEKSIVSLRNKIPFHISNVFYVMGEYGEKSRFTFDEEEQIVKISGMSWLCPTYDNDYRFIKGNSIYAPRWSAYLNQVLMTNKYKIDTIPKDNQVSKFLPYQSHSTTFSKNHIWSKELDIKIRAFMENADTFNLLSNPDLFYQNIQDEGFIHTMKKIEIILPISFDYPSVSLSSIGAPIPFIKACLARNRENDNE